MSMKKPRIDTDAAIDWAREVLQRDAEALWAGEVPQEQLDTALQEYNIAHGIATDGIYQDVDDATPRIPVDVSRWWGKGGAK
jgi:hypothetical protein